MIYATTSGSELRVRLLRWVIPAWLSLTSLVLIAHQLSLSQLENAVQADADSAEIDLLEGRVNRLEQFNIDAQRLPKRVTEVELNQLSDTISLRMTDLRKSLHETATVTDLHALQLQLQLQLLETKHQQTIQSPAPSKPSIKHRKAPRPIEPTFQIIGLELRGGERFLSVAPVGAHSLDQSRVMRIGETHDGWQLESFDQQTAVFLVNGKTRRLNVR